MSYTDLLVKIINIQKSKPLKFSLIMKEKQYKLNDVTIYNIWLFYKKRYKRELNEQSSVSGH